MGGGYWKQGVDSELQACLIYNNGYPGTDRSHGPGIYPQNMSGSQRLISDNLVAGDFSTGMQMYGSRTNEMVNDYLVEGNVWFAPREEAKGRNYILCGGAKSRNLEIKDNVSYGYDMRIGPKANQISEGNTVIHASLGGPGREQNRVLKEGQGSEVIIHPNHYDPRRAKLIVINWSKGETVSTDLGAFLEKGEAFRVLNALDFFGSPLVEGIYDGAEVKLPLPEIPWDLDSGSARELGVYVIMKRDQN